MTKDELLSRIDTLIGRCRQNDGPVRPEAVFNGALTLMIMLYGPDSQQLATLIKRRDEVSKFAEGARTSYIIRTVLGVLENLREEVEAGLLTSVEQRVASDILSDLVQLAREALTHTGDGPKNVAAVLAAAAYEDTIRRTAKEHAGVIGQDKLETVIAELKDAGLLVPPQLGIVLGHLNFRNRALHAQWDEIDRVPVETALALVEQLLLKHFG